MANSMVRYAALGVVLAASGCGGGGGDDPPAPPGPPSGWVAGSFSPAASFAGRCVSPRSGLDPATAAPYTDIQGTTLDENNWLRSWSNDLYLWYDEIVDRDPGLYTTPQYFDLLKTPAFTPSGRDKDRFHFTYPTTEWLSLAQSGVESGYGALWAVLSGVPPRRIVVAYTEPGSPASSAALQRGEEVVEVDGVDVVNSNTPAAAESLVAGLYPDSLGEAHTFMLQDPQTGALRVVTLQSAAITKTPVLMSSIIQTTSGRVGYLLFNDHLATAERQLIAAVEQMQAAPIDDLVLDLRYNGGGFLAIASQLAYMIAGPAYTAGQTFERLEFNDKHTSVNPFTGEALTPVPFYSTTLGLSTVRGQQLPTLNLTRVYVLTGGTTCSASESIINGLRGVNLQVIQIGSSTCGKPYGFVPTDNCGTTYFSVNFKGVNAAAFGDYTDGFSPSNIAGPAGTLVPGCSVADDFAAALGATSEDRLAAALAHRLGAACPVPSGSKPLPSKPLNGGEVDAFGMKSPWLMNRWLGGP